MISVVNKYKHKPTKNDIYIGRGSILGNPFSYLKGTKALYIVESREIAIEKYEIWLRDKIKNKDIEICKMLNEIWLKAKKEDINLICYCFPKLCHGDIIKKIIEENL